VGTGALARATDAKHRLYLNFFTTSSTSPS